MKISKVENRSLYFCCDRNDKLGDFGLKNSFGTVLDSELFALAHRHGKSDIEKGSAPLVRALMAKPPSGKASTNPSPVPISQQIKLQIRSDEYGETVAQLRDIGCNIISLGAEPKHGRSRVVVASIVEQNLSKLDDVKAIVSVEASRTMTPLMDEARGEITKADLAVEAYPDLDGTDVVIGIVDTGIDWRHNDFLGHDKKTRIETLLVATDNDDETFDEYSKADIDAALSGSSEVPPPLDKDGHGTHVSSVAAGTGAMSGGRYRGIAPNATIIVADPAKDRDVILAVEEIFKRAGDRPAVVNLSLGMHEGAHDGSSALEVALANHVGPGRIIVAAAGNDGDNKLYFRGDLGSGVPLVVDIKMTVRVVELHTYTDAQIGFETIIIDPDGTEHDLETFEFLSDGVLYTAINGLGAVFIEGNTVTTSGKRLRQFVFSVLEDQKDDVWKLKFVAGPDAKGVMDIWAQPRGAGRDGSRELDQKSNIILNHTGPTGTVTIPATEECLISVASIVSRPDLAPGKPPADPKLKAGTLSSYSAHGPTPHGVQAPQIAAPGQNVVGALAANSRLADEHQEFKDRRLENLSYISLRGTSVATPFVTGVIALMLQQRPDLSYTDVQQRFALTSQWPSDSPSEWHPGWGFGIIDVKALLGFDSSV